MNKFLCALLLAIAAPSLCLAQQPLSDAASIQTVAIFRHGEKPGAGLGMLSCQGLNRALALPGRLLEIAGAPDAAFAPNPSSRKPDKGVPYDYNRPLLTVAPAAIQAGIPVNVQYPMDAFAELALALADPSFAGKTVYVAWEHHLAAKLAARLLSAAAEMGAAADSLPPQSWPDSDYDSVWIVRILRVEGSPFQASFSIVPQGLDGLGAECPNPLKGR